MQNIFRIGQFYEKEVTITSEIGKEFARISGDFNPIHLDEKYAEETRFGKRIVHGMLIGSYISGIIGNEFPGQGSIYLNQDLKFRRPIFYDKKVIIRVEIISVDEEKSRLKLRTSCLEDNDVLVDGEALIYMEK